MMKPYHIKHIIALLFAVLFFGTNASSQKDNKVKILNADYGGRDPKITEANRLIGNVRLKYGDAIMHCDSAYIYDNEDFNAFSNIRVNQGDTLNMRGELLHFDKESETAQLRNNIQMKDKDMTLTTNKLDYNLETELAHYFGGGTLSSTTNKNELTSDEGIYDSKSENFFFRKNVVLNNPEYTIISDTLKYNNIIEQVWFFGPTTITTTDTEIYCENGWYDTKNDLSQFDENATISSESSILRGDSIFYNGKTKFGEIFCNVEIVDTTNNFIITGDYGWYNESTGESLVTDRALMIQAFETDSLFLHADTLMSITDSVDNKYIYAFHSVRLFKPDLQGVCDSLSYSEKDSLLTMFTKPLLWSDANQISGDTIAIQIIDGSIDKLFVRKNSFIISEATPSKYNQVKGKHMTGHFEDNELRTLFVDGNGETIYYPLENDTDPPKTVGMNKAVCSNMKILIVDSEINSIYLLDKPSGALIPNSKISSEEELLKGFLWESSQRPLSKDDLFRLPQVLKK